MTTKMTWYAFLSAQSQIYEVRNRQVDTVHENRFQHYFHNESLSLSVWRSSPH